MQLPSDFEDISDIAADIQKNEWGRTGRSTKNDRDRTFLTRVMEEENVDDVGLFDNPRLRTDDYIALLHPPPVQQWHSHISTVFGLLLPCKDNPD